MNSGGFLVTISGATTSKLALTGNLDLSTSLDSLLVSGTLNGTSTYTAITYTGTRTGTFNEFSGLTAQGYFIDHSIAGQVNLTSVHEPASVLGVAFAGFAVWAGVRHRYQMLGNMNTSVGAECPI